MDNKSKSTVAVVIVFVIFMCQLALIVLNPPWQFPALIVGLFIEAVILVWGLRNKLQRLKSGAWTHLVHSRLDLAPGIR